MTTAAAARDERTDLEHRAGRSRVLALGALVPGNGSARGLTAPRLVRALSGDSPSPVTAPSAGRARAVFAFVSEAENPSSTADGNRVGGALVALAPRGSARGGAGATLSVGDSWAPRSTEVR